MKLKKEMWYYYAPALLYIMPCAKKIKKEENVTTGYTVFLVFEKHNNCFWFCELPNQYIECNKKDYRKIPKLEQTLLGLKEVKCESLKHALGVKGLYVNLNINSWVK